MVLAGAISQTPRPETSQTSTVTATNWRTPLSMISTPMIDQRHQVRQEVRPRAVQQRRDQHAPAGPTQSRGSMPNWSSR